jgi:hypothetical protein
MRLHTEDPIPNEFRALAPDSVQPSSRSTAIHIDLYFRPDFLTLLSTFSDCFLDERVSLLLSCGESESSEDQDDSIEFHLQSEELISHRLSRKHPPAAYIIREPRRSFIFDGVCSPQTSSVLKRQI